jgi:site-specific DNA-adenine methylase
MNSLLPVLLVVALLVVLGILFTGLFAMARGGEFNRKYGNRLMRWRVIAQAVALVILALAFLLTRP